MSSSIPRYARAAIAAGAVALAAAACGSSSSTTSSSTTTSASTPSTTSTASSTPATTSTPASTAGKGNFLEYTGGKAGGTSGAPIQIGWLNEQGGESVPAPLATAGAETAVKYVNEELGGVDGHPIELDTCFIASSEQEGTTCGQKFVANKSVDIVDTGGVAVGIQPFYSTINATKPVMVGVALTPVDNVQKNGSILFGDSSHIDSTAATYVKDVLHAKTAALVYENDPALLSGASGIEAGLKSLGVSVKAVSYSDSTTDLTGPLASAGASSADAVVVMAVAAGCANMAKSLQSVGISGDKVVSMPLCLNSQVHQALGDFPKWTYAIASSNFGDMTDPWMAPFMKVVAKYGATAEAPDPWFMVSFSEILTTVRLMNELGYGHITPAALQAKLKAFNGPLALGAPELACGAVAAAPAVCNTRAQFFKYDGSNKFVKAAGWLQAPAS